jgi:hypothetical protein
MSIIQEKYETIFPDKETDPGPWKDPKSARVTEHGFKALTPPPGENVFDQEAPPKENFPFSMGGATDVSADYNETAVKEGFSKRKMRPTDDMYTREHNDAFYDDVGGFAERNNMLDRE